MDSVCQLSKKCKRLSRLRSMAKYKALNQLSVVLKGTPKEKASDKPHHNTRKKPMPVLILTHNLLRKVLSIPIHSCRAKYSMKSWIPQSCEHIFRKHVGSLTFYLLFEHCQHLLYIYISFIKTGTYISVLIHF